MLQAFNNSNGGTQAEATAADQEAALAAAHRQLSLQAGSSEAQNLDMQAQCTFLEAALKVRLQSGPCVLVCGAPKGSTTYL